MAWLPEDITREVPKRYLLFLPKILSFEAPVLIVESGTEQVDQIQDRRDRYRTGWE